MLSASVGASYAATPDTAIRYVYDDAGRLKAVSDPATETATYSWDAVGNLLSVRRVGSLSLSVIQVSPTRGQVGMTVTVYGTGFRTVASDNTVKFNGTATTVTSAAKTELVVKVPTGATTGAVSVTTPDGTATSADPFVVTQPNRPVVTSISPTIANRGDLVTVTGTNFGERTTNVATVNETRAGVESETATSLALKVPEMNASGRVSVTSFEGTGVGPDLFVAPPLKMATQIGVTGRMTVGETKNFTIPAPKELALYVFDATAGQRVAYTYSGSDSFSRLQVITPDGSYIEPPTAGEPLDVPKTGTYTFYVDGSANMTGTITTFEVPPDQDQTIVPTQAGAARTLTFNVARQNANLRFSGQAGQWISVQGSAVTGGGSYFVDVRKPDGTILGGSSVFFSPFAQNFIDAVELSADGTYSIHVDPINATTGSLTITTYDATPLTGPLQPTAGGTSQNVPLSTPGRNASFSFGGTGGDKVSLRMLQNTFASPLVRIYNPDGTS